MSRIHRAPVPPRTTQSSKLLKLVYNNTEYQLNDDKITIGRHKHSTISLIDPMVSGNHCHIINNFITDLHSTNGTIVNNKTIKPDDKHLLRAGDVLLIGEAKMEIKTGEAKNNQTKQDLNRSKKFIKPIVDHNNNENNSNKANSNNNIQHDNIDKTVQQQQQQQLQTTNGDTKDINIDDAESNMTVLELMKHEFDKIIGHDSIKQQLRQFYKKVQLDGIRQKNQKLNNDNKGNRLYHMIFSGPPGTGKTTMANVVAKILVKMGLLQSDKVVFVNNPLELLAGYVGQTPGKVDSKVEEARNGVLFIDEAYSLLKEANSLGGGSTGNTASFAKEAIDTIMKHLDPPTCVFIFAGYEKQMNEFLKVNEGLSRRIPYRYTFLPYNTDELVQIFNVMCISKGEILSQDAQDNISMLLESIPNQQRSVQNAGCVGNLLSFAQLERDDRLDIEEAIQNPDLASRLEYQDLCKAIDKVKQMAVT